MGECIEVRKKRDGALRGEKFMIISVANMAFTEGGQMSGMMLLLYLWQEFP